MIKLELSDEEFEALNGFIIQTIAEKFQDGSLKEFEKANRPLMNFFANVIARHIKWLVYKK